MKADLSGKIALITGSTRGIGKAIAFKLAANGADVAINGRNPQAATDVIKEIEKIGRRCIFEKADVNIYSQVRAMVDSVLAQWGSIDILVASGASGDPPPLFFNDIDPATYGDYFRTRTFTRLYCVKAVLDHMKEKQRGKIILLTTDAGRIATPGESLNGGAAASLVLITKALASEFGRWKIHINTIATTTVIDTPGLEYAKKIDSTGKIFERVAQRMPFWPLQSSDIAEMALYLSSADSDRITGQIFSINGGLSFPG